MHAVRSAVLRSIVAAAAVAACAAVVPSTAGALVVPVKRVLLPAPPAPETPEPFIPPKGTHLGRSVDLNRVGIVEVGPKTAHNVLVLEPGTSAGAGYFIPFAKSLVEHTKGWQVWAVERRENFLEDQTMLARAKAKRATSAEAFCYYLGFLAGGGCKPHFIPLIPLLIPAAEAEAIKRFAQEWGMNVAVDDLHVVIEAAKALGGKVVLGGHSLGGSVVTAYATWDFSGTPGADGLSGLVYDDGGSSPIPITKEKAEEELGALRSRTLPGTAWLSFGGIQAPFLGLFSALGSTGTLVSPEEASLAESFPLLPESLKPKNPAGCELPQAGCERVPVSNEAEFGYGVNVGTSPPALIAAQIHAGSGIETGALNEAGVHPWNDSGALTPLRRYAEMLSAPSLHNADGSEWYFPERLTIDTGAVADGNPNEAQEVLGEHAIHGHELPTSLKILAINSELDKAVGANSLTAAEILAEQSGIPKSNLTLIEAGDEYAHNDPAGADPAVGGLFANKFFRNMVPFLEEIAGST
jgi:pimeloyl-ACP methyl ester carboxylesterase